MDKVWQEVKQHKYYIGVIAGLVVVLGIFISMQLNQNPKPEVLGEEVVMAEESDSSEEEQICEVFADISGAVQVPGVYCLEATAVVKDLIEMAGGLAKKHCKLWVSRELNGASLVENGMKLFVPSEKDNECKQKEANTETAIEGGGLISINRAVQSELEDLPGVGPALSKRIIESRPFSKLEDIKEVKGIGESLYNKIRDKISL